MTRLLNTTPSGDCFRVPAESIEASDLRWAKHRFAVERWKTKNRQYYLAQKRRLGQRPEYLQHRREMYRIARARQTVDSEPLSSMENDITKTNERTSGRGDCGGVAADDPAQRSGADAA